MRRLCGAHRCLLLPAALSVVVACSREDSLSRPELPDGSCRPEVIAASRSGDLAAVRRLISRGAKITCGSTGTDARRETPLTIAVDSRNLELLSLLISYGVKAGAELDDAISSNRLDVVRLLLDAGVSASVSFRPTMPAGAIRLLLEHGADPNRRTCGRWTGAPSFVVAPQLSGEYCTSCALTPLIEGAQAGSDEFVRILLEHGADPSLTDEQGRTALDVARLHGYQSIATQLEPVTRATRSVERPRQRVHHVRPVIPPIAVVAGNEGPVIVRVTVERDGRVTQAKVVCSLPLLDDNALEAVKQWRYKPADEASMFTVAVDFTLPRQSRLQRP